MPRPRKPEVLKLISGTNQPCRVREEVAMPKVDRVPDPPAWLTNPDALEEWDRLAPQLFAVGLLTGPAVSPLAILCGTFGAIVAAMAEGQINSALINSYRAFCGDFGMTPASASKVKPVEQKRANAFTRNGQRPAVA